MCPPFKIMPPLALLSKILEPPVQCPRIFRIPLALQLEKRRTAALFTAPTDLSESDCFRTLSAAGKAFNDSLACKNAR